MSTQTAFRAHFARDAGYLAGEAIQLINHGVERFFQLQNLAAHIDRDLLGEIALGDRGCDFGNITDLAGQVAGHEVYVIGEIFPGTADAEDLRLTAQLAFGAHFARHAGYFAGEGVELVDHRVDRILQFQNFALYVYRDLAREVAARDGRSDLGDIPHLGGEIARHGIDRVGQILPRAGHARHDRLSAEFSVGTDFTGHASYFRREGPELIDHCVDGFLELQNFAANVDRNLPRQIAASHGGRYLCDVAHLAGQVAGH